MAVAIGLEPGMVTGSRIRRVRDPTVPMRLVDDRKRPVQTTAP